jgi:hypothetical protein
VASCVLARQAWISNGNDSRHICALFLEYQQVCGNLMNDALLTAGNSSLSIVKLVFGNLTLLLSTGYHNFWKRRMAHGKKMVKIRLMINSGIEMYRHNTAGAVRVLIPKMLCVLSEIAQPA